MSNYGTVAGFLAYFTARGNTAAIAAAEDEPETLAALVVASDWIDGTYRALFGGSKTGGRAQVLEWPRTGAYVADGVVEGGAGSYWYGAGNEIRHYLASDEIPREVENATYELAWRQINSPGSLDTDYTASAVITKARVEGAVSVEYAGANAMDGTQLSMPAVEKIIAPVLTGANAGVSSLSGRLVRI